MKVMNTSVLFFAVLASFLAIASGKAKVPKGKRKTVCNWCFDRNTCFAPDEALYPEPSTRCWTCIQLTCGYRMNYRDIAIKGIDCLRKSWRGKRRCKKVCPAWQKQYRKRIRKCKICLKRCIAKGIGIGAGQCTPQTSITGSPTTCSPREHKSPCGTCYRTNRCFTKDELLRYGMCNDYIKLKCPGDFNATCVKEAWATPCSECPPLTPNWIVRLDSCGLCLTACSKMSSCLTSCKKEFPIYPKALSCPTCRALCAATDYPSNCEATRCDCASCDSCVAQCKAEHGSNLYNLLDPCKCLEYGIPTSSGLAARIIGGTNACDGDWPWMAYIYEVGKGIQKGGLCGGSLISDQWVLAAAHCFATPGIPSLYGVILGEQTISGISGNELFLNVEQVIPHHDYNTFTFNNDIAIVKLTSRVIFNQFVQPINMATSDTRTDNDEAPTFAGKPCIALGWGFTTSTNGQRTDSLKQIGLVINPRSVCNILTLTHAKDYANRIVTKADPKFCAGGRQGEDTCQGDSGGPLFCLHEDQTYYLHGITSYGPFVCGEQNKPGIYTKVAGLRGWIDDRLNPSADDDDDKE